MIDALLTACAPGVGPVTMAAIVSYESGGRSYAIGDNTTHRSYYPASRASGAALVRTLMREGHDIDVGLAQVNVGNFSAYGLDAESALDPCRNVAAGAQILTEAYTRAVKVYGPGQRALAHALSAYNTGQLSAGSTYARGVWSEGLKLRGPHSGRVVTIVRGRADGRVLAISHGKNAVGAP